MTINLVSRHNVSTILISKPLEKCSNPLGRNMARKDPKLWRLQYRLDPNLSPLPSREQFMQRNLGLKLERMSSFGVSYVCDHHSSTPPPLTRYIRRIFEVIARHQSVLGSLVPAHFLLKFLQFCRDLAAMDVPFAQFLELKGQNSQFFSCEALLITPPRDIGVGVAAGRHLGSRLGGWR